MVSDWLKTQKKRPRTNQIRANLTTNLRKNGHGSQQTNSQKDVLFTVFRFLEYFFNFSIVVLLTNYRHGLLRTVAIFS